VSNRFFFLLLLFDETDRLYGTLEDRMEKWAEQNVMFKSSSCCGMGGGGGNATKQAQTQLLKERMLVAYDLTVAFDYLHSLRLLYRDIKPGTPNV
jgi:hypothetical protein